MKKKLDFSHIVNELEGASVFFPSKTSKQARPTPLVKAESEPPKTKEPRNQVSQEPSFPGAQELEASPSRQEEPQQVDTRTPYDPYAVRPVRRRPRRRWAYELYEDQVEAIRRLADQEATTGGRGSASAMVREAIDQWLERRKKPEG